MSLEWRNIIITSERSIKDALVLIDSEALRIVLVTDNAKRLVGVVTDGDIRRGLLRNMTLDCPVRLVMNRTPITVDVSMPAKAAQGLMEKHGILAVPVLDDGAVVGLESLQFPMINRIYEHPVFLMAGGFGTRLRPLTNDCPKPLLKLDDRPILEIILTRFVKAGFKNFYISTHFMPEKIREHFGDGTKWGVSISYVHESEPLGTGGAIGLLPDNIPDLPLILMNGDVLTTIDFEALIKFHEKSAPAATLCVREYEHQIPFGVINGDGKRVVSMVEKPINRCFTNAGIYVLEPEIRKAVQPGVRVDLPTVLEHIISENKEVLMYPVHEYWLDIGRIDEFNKAQVDISRLGI